MIRRLLLLIVAALVAPLPTVWLFYHYGLWLYERIQDIGIDKAGSVLLTFFFCALAAMVLIALIAWIAVFKEKEIARWIKTGKIHA